MEELSLHILDIAENSIDAGATTIGIAIMEDFAQDLLTMEVTDNGRGMDAKKAANIADPFFTTRTTRRVGLGAAFLDEAARAAGGKTEITSTPGVGTSVRASFRLSHVDRKPLGDLPETIIAIIARQPGIDITYRHTRDRRSVQFTTAELRQRLDGAPLNDAATLGFIKRFLTQEEESLVHNT